MATAEYEKRYQVMNWHARFVCAVSRAFIFPQNFVPGGRNICIESKAFAINPLPTHWVINVYLMLMNKNKTVHLKMCKNSRPVSSVRGHSGSLSVVVLSFIYLPCFEVSGRIPVS